jgi:protein-S-isoprenylcysteine O-methyltransferase Ste14
MMKMRWYIDMHKGATGLAVLAMMGAFDQWANSTAWIYLALHGTYGLLWVLKSRIYPDKSWERPASLGRGLVIWFGLTLYWITPWMITSAGVHAPYPLLAGATSLFVIGVFLHFTTDMQKHTALTMRPEHLITTGMMARTRNLNYFGELLIYLALALLAMHWLPLLVLLAFVVFVWIPNMRRKDRSLARYLEFDAYRRRTKWFIPFVA